MPRTSDGETVDAVYKDLCNGGDQAPFFSSPHGSAFPIPP